MYTTAQVSNFPADPFQTTLPFAPGYDAAEISSKIASHGSNEEIGLREPGRCAYQPPRASRLIRSVVEEAGLGRFVYLQGKSGRRYVFSSISDEQVSLYDNALFAVSNRGGEIVEIGKCAQGLKARGLNVQNGQLYVHLLDDAVTDSVAALLDLDELDA